MVGWPPWTPPVGEALGSYRRVALLSPDREPVQAPDPDYIGGSLDPELGPVADLTDGAERAARGGGLDLVEGFCNELQIRGTRCSRQVLTRGVLPK